MRILPLALILLSLSAAAQDVNQDSLKQVEKLRKKFMKELPNWTYVPAGKFTYQENDQDTPPQEPTRVLEAGDFFMLRGEVTNFNWLEFIYHQKKKDSIGYTKLLPDTTVWRTPLAYCEPYVDYYYQHPAYQSYPLVGVSYEQAQIFCEWLTEILNASPEKIFKKVKARLPTEEEWEWAARGGHQNSIYPWGGPYMRNAECDYLANCVHFGSARRDTVYIKNDKGEFEERVVYIAISNDYMGVAGNLNDAADITAPVESYWPNDYGLFNMAGNVCEMVEEVGVTRGGSWKDPAYYCENSVAQYYEGTTTSSAKRGFRPILEVVEY